MKISARNQIPARVVSVTAGPATAVVELDCNGMRLMASITVEAAHELGIAAGRDATAIVNASDVMLGVAD